MTEPVAKVVQYRLSRRAATPERSYFVITFLKPTEHDKESFVKLSCSAFNEIMGSNRLEYFVPGDHHLECNGGESFSTDDSKWRQKFLEDDSFVPGQELKDLILERQGEEGEISFSFFGPRTRVEKFFDPEGDYSHQEVDPEWYCEGSYVDS